MGSIVYYIVNGHPSDLPERIFSRNFILNISPLYYSPDFKFVIELLVEINLILKWISHGSFCYINRDEKYGTRRRIAYKFVSLIANFCEKNQSLAYQSGENLLL